MVMITIRLNIRINETLYMLLLYVRIVLYFFVDLPCASNDLFYAYN